MIYFTKNSLKTLPNSISVSKYLKILSKINENENLQNLEKMMKVKN